MEVKAECKKCIKSDVCKIKENYMKQVKTIKDETEKLIDENIQYSIRCTRYHSGSIF